MEAGLAESTKRVYRAGWKRYITFAGSVAIPDVPITSESVTLFAAFLGAEGLAISTIESYLAALRHVHLLTNPSCPALSWHSPHMKVLLRGICRVQAHHSPAWVRLPITSSLMRCIKAQLAKSPSSHMSLLIWAACCTGYFGFLRCREFLVPDGTQYDASIHLLLADSTLNQSSSPWRITLNIKKSRQISSVRERRSFWGQWGLIFVLWVFCWTFCPYVGGSPAHCSVCKIAAHSIGQCLYSKSKQPSHHRVWRGQILTDTVSGLGQPLQQALQVCQNRQLRFLDTGRAWHTSPTSALPSKIWQKYHLISADWARGHCVFKSVCLGAWLIKCVGWSYYGSLVYLYNHSSSLVQV